MRSLREEYKHKNCLLLRKAYRQFLCFLCFGVMNGEKICYNRESLSGFIVADEEWRNIMNQKALQRRRLFDRMDGFEFEEYCAALLRRNGYKKVEVTRASMDQGIDIIAYKRKTSYGIQCKNHANKITNKAVQEAYTGCCFYGLDVPVVLTNNFFTIPAQQLAEKTGVELWDRETLLKLKKHKNWFGIISGVVISILVIGGLFAVIYYLKGIF